MILSISHLKEGCNMCKVPNSWTFQFKKNTYQVASNCIGNIVDLWRSQELPFIRVTISQLNLILR